jgi:hypothetical protein
MTDKSVEETLLFVLKRDHEVEMAKADLGSVDIQDSQPV